MTGSYQSPTDLSAEHEASRTKNIDLVRFADDDSKRHMRDGSSHDIAERPAPKSVRRAGSSPGGKMFRAEAVPAAPVRRRSLFREGTQMLNIVIARIVVDFSPILGVVTPVPVAMAYTLP